MTEITAWAGVLAMDDNQISPFTQTSEEAMFLCAAGRVVLMGYREPEGWVLARAWRSQDRLTDVRRWRFSERTAFVAQVFRLVRDDAEDHRVARTAEVAAASWVAAQVA